MWLYLAFKFAGLTLAYFPRKVGYLVARIVADTVYLLSPSMRASISDNMKHVLGPDVESARLKRAVRGVLRNAARNYFDLIKIPHTKLADIESSLVVSGWNHMEAALESGKGVILVTAHLGSFDVAAQILAVRSVKTIGLVEPLEPPSLLRHVIALRNSKGLNFTAAQAGVPKAVMRSLRRGETVVLACDRDVGKDGMKLNFFGEETSMPSLAVRLAMRKGAVVIPVLSWRRDDGRYDMFFEPAIDIVPGGDEAVARNMEQIIRVMENFIRRCPEQWAVLGPIWPKAH